MLGETNEAITMALTVYPKARKIAVENFVSSASSSNTMANALNLEYDSKVYRWDYHTVKAIQYAMRRCGKL